MGIGGFSGDFNLGRASDRRLPNGFLQNLETNPFLTSQCFNQSSNGLDLCKKLSKMGISCDMSIWSSRPEPFRVDPRDFGSRGSLHGFPGFDQNLSAASRIRNVSSGFLQNTFHGVSPGELRLLGFQDSVNPNGFEEMMTFKNHRVSLFDHMNRPTKRSSISLRGVTLQNDALKGGSLMFEGNRVSRGLSAMEASRELGASHPQDSLRGVSLGNDALIFQGNRVSRSLAAMEASGELGAFYPEDRLRGVSLRNDALVFEGNRVSPALAAMEVSEASSLIGQGSYGKMNPKNRTGLPLDLVSMVNIYGSVNLMAKDQIGCRVLQILVDEGTFPDFKVLFFEIINHVVELSMDPFGNYIVQKLLDVCDEEQRMLIVSVLTSKSTELIKICLNNYGTRVVQKMIETVKTKQQIEMVKSSLKPGFLALVKDLNGNHVIQTCLNSLGPNDNKFVLEAATRYCAEIATHRHGCCVLQCCISNSVGAQREILVDEISRNSLHLSQDPYGNYVVQYLIEQNVPSMKLLMQFRMHYVELATQKFSSHVVEKCLKHYPESRAEIVRELLSVPNFEYILQDPFGNYVIQTALSKTKASPKSNRTYTTKSLSKHNLTWVFGLKQGRVHTRLVEQVHRYGILKSSPYCKKIFSNRILNK
ncbi:hypothetical protein EUTSA_v10001811mg [Eutrema salsugineum]|uniref:PUM-HD domain-containing protein n=1 Tax=Eutrema salsugineum TaxID=72664 RepID=V4L5G2_EUTSA|nr:hypothetical protein EUTSA_v10001811mg [Eutrema salsugineum]